MKPIDMASILYYEVSGSWWAKYLSSEWAQELAASYFAWKTKRKYARYKMSLDISELLG